MEPKPLPNTEITPVVSHTPTTAHSPLPASVIGACSRLRVLALSTKLAQLQFSFAIDTGAAVNVLSEGTYSAVKRRSRGDRYPLHPNYLYLTEVGADKLNILGVVRLPDSLGKSPPPLRLDFKALTQFALPCDGLIELPSLESYDVVNGVPSLQGAGRAYAFCLALEN